MPSFLTPLYFLIFFDPHYQQFYLNNSILYIYVLLFNLIISKYLHNLLSVKIAMVVD